ncbi:MAG TPA: DUF4383 domain-containing protein [Xenococcaceae cyanobacterium]
MQRKCALALGIVFLVLGIAGFIPSLVSLPSPDFDSSVPLTVDSFYAKGFGLLFGLFPTNLMHNLVHLTVGLLGIAAASTPGGARLYNRSFAISYLLIAVMGLFPLAKTTFGLMPIFGNNVWFNALAGAIAGYFGFALPESVPSDQVMSN